jgi:hypothetical protein
VALRHCGFPRRGNSRIAGEMNQSRRAVQSRLVGARLSCILDGHELELARAEGCVEPGLQKSSFGSIACDTANPVAPLQEGFGRGSDHHVGLDDDRRGEHTSPDSPKLL